MSVSHAFAKDLKKENEELANVNIDVVEAVCTAFLKHIIDSCKKGESVTFKNSLTFKRVLRKDRTHSNPKTKEKIFKPQHYAMVLEMKSTLKKEFSSIEVVSSGGGEEKEASSSSE